MTTFPFEEDIYVLTRLNADSYRSCCCKNESQTERNMLLQKMFFSSDKKSEFWLVFSCYSSEERENT